MYWGRGTAASVVAIRVALRVAFRVKVVIRVRVGGCLEFRWLGFRVGVVLGLGLGYLGVLWVRSKRVFGFWGLPFLKSHFSI